MVNKFVFNRKKENTIVLIHGLYTTSGFWLSYFKLFNNYRIIVFDINYDNILNSDYSKNILKGIFHVDGNIVGVISHSFGTVISDLVFDQNYEMIYKICPVAFSKRLESSNFVLDIVNKTIFTEDAINNNIKIVRSYLLKVKKSLSDSGHLYIPNMDCYFSYKLPKKKKIEFTGDHFNISFALENIIDDLSICN
jgi:hypothetical protein